MKWFFENPKRAVFFIAFVVLCIVMAIGGAMMALSMGGNV